LIFDDKYEKKAAYDGVQDALRSICSSSPNDDDDGGSSTTTTTTTMTTITPPWYLESDYDEEGNEWGSDWMTPEEPAAPEEGSGGGESGGGRTEAGRDTTKEGQPDWLQP
jgi:hypothetical protein